MPMASLADEESLMPKQAGAVLQAPHGVAGNHRPRQRGFTVPELLITALVGTVLTVVAVPMFYNALNSMRLSNMVSNLSGIISSTRYQAIMKNQVYTLEITAPANTYVVTNFTTTTAGAATPLANGQTVKINGGSGATYTFTFCPNGTVYGSGGGCPNANAIPALQVTYGSRQVNIAVSTVGNVTTTTIQ
jgi:prepilin-type N-terminal cleavage/methylation domain-containing protein